MKKEIYGIFFLVCEQLSELLKREFGKEGIDFFFNLGFVMTAHNSSKIRPFLWIPIEMKFEKRAIFNGNIRKKVING